MRRTRFSVDCAELGSGLDTVDALARMQLNACRAGGRIELRNAAPSLLELLDLTGLAELLPLIGERKAPQGEEARRVEEEREFGDPSFS